MEDYFGDLDMKIASTSDGITAIQADIKIHGLPIAIVYECMERAHAAKKQLLHKMTECLPTHRTNRKDCWPLIITFETKKPVRAYTVNGKNLVKFIADQGASGLVSRFGMNVFAPSQAAADKIKEAVKHFNKLCDVEMLKRGANYSMRIVELTESGVMVQLNDAMKPAFIPLKQLDKRSVAHPAALGLAIDDVIRVKFLGEDPKTGDLRLSKTMVKTVTVDMIIKK